MPSTAYHRTTQRPHRTRSGAGPNVLVVVAHPDDEYYCAAIVYRLTHELGGTVDELIITNGAGGYRYALLAEGIYGYPLTRESVGRTRLPLIRRNEALRAGRILGIRQHYFLDQPDVAFAPDLEPSIGRVWDRPFIERQLDTLLALGGYDYVFVVLPTEDTHPHHQATALLALERVARIEEATRPVVLGCTYRSSTDAPVRAAPVLQGHPQAQVLGDGPLFSFDRRHKFGFDAALDYTVVVHWMMAEYKSQGLFQTAYGVDDAEDLWYFRANAPGGRAKAEVLFTMLNPRPPALPRRVRWPTRPRWRGLSLPRWLYRNNATTPEG